MSANEQVVREFLAAWSRLDVEELVGYFTPDGTYTTFRSPRSADMTRCASLSPGLPEAGPARIGKCCISFPVETW